MRFSKLTAGALVLIVSMMLAWACGSKKIDLAAPSITEESYYNSEVSFTKTVYGIYARLTDWYNFNGDQSNVQLPVMANLPGDDVTVTSNDAFEHFGPLNGSNSRNGGFWSSAYQVISRANILLEKQAEESGVYKSPGLKGYHRGEALFLRAFAYYYLWNFYGKAPLVTERIKTVDQWTTPESSGTQMLDTAIRDLQEASGILPDAWPANQKGRAVKNSAFGLLGKALVIRASFTNNDADYAAAITAFNSITGVSLVANFDDNFAYDTENNAESLFEFQASKTPGDNVWLPNEFDAAIGRMGYFSGFYDNNFALFGAATHSATQKLVDAFDPDDPRLELTLDPATKAIRKYVSRNVLADNGVTSVNNPRMLRYADVLLLKAEALLQSGGSKPDAIGLINEVRTRARGAGTEPANYAPSETNDATIMEWIMNERFLELAGEGQRWIDLRRWHQQGIITLNNAFFAPTNPGAMNFLPARHLYFPIPTSETDRNPNVTQNPDY